MVTDSHKKSQSRMVIAVTLFIASIATSFGIAFISSQGSAYWVITEPIPEGAKISSEDVALVKIKLVRAATGYIQSSISPVGAVSKRALSRGEILHQGALANSDRKAWTGSVSLAIRSLDIPPSSQVGDMVSIYQLHDLRNGESSIDPRLVISEVFIEGISGREGNFSGDFSVTVSLDRRDIPDLLAATTSGRLVIVGSSG
jgi:hypothetical protein